MVGIGETYIAAFALALGFGQIISGLITVVPVLLGATVQLFSGFALRHFSSRRRWVMLCAVTQASCLLILAVIAHQRMASAGLIFSVVSLFWAGGMSAGPAWNAWMGNVVPKRLRLSFFSRRSRITQGAVLSGLVVGGVLLHLTAHSTFPLSIFAVLFLFASICRFLSAIFLALQTDDAPYHNVNRELHEAERSKVFIERSVYFLFLYFFLNQITVQISAPFSTPYMLKQLELGYGYYMVLIGAALFARILTYTYVPKLVQKHGATFLVVMSAVGIMPLPALWTLGSSFEYLFCVQLLAGFMWGCHELGMFLVLLDKYPAEKRSMVLTNVNFCNSIGMFFGSLVGAHILRSGNLSFESYHHIFWISSSLRVLPLFCLPIFLGKKKIFFHMMMRVIGVRPDAGAVSRPILHVDKESKGH